MARRPEHSSGAKRDVRLKLSPWHLQRLRDTARSKDITRTRLIELWLEGRLNDPGAKLCRHLNSYVAGGGVKVCRDCEMKRGADNEWR